ncbi:hypothetical protein GW764_01675 [Candidatus Parcubacteria bacterium]|nr:hypothetical protein [Candidatus Parcubacteria bacterium]
MNKIEFNEENEFYIKTRRHLGEYENSKMEKILLDKGIVKNRRQATYFLIGLVIFLIAVNAYVYLSLIYTPKDDYVVGPDGERYSVEEYMEELGKGNNILDPEI